MQALQKNKSLRNPKAKRKKKRRNKILSKGFFFFPIHVILFNCAKLHLLKYHNFSYFSEDDILKELEELSIEAQGGKADREPSTGKVNTVGEGEDYVIGNSWDTRRLCPRKVSLCRGWDS